VGYNDHEFVLALGREPVGIRDWVGVGPVTKVPWAKERIARIESKPKLLSRNELNVEEVAKLRPDLIIGLFGGITKREYETLSRIAPTVGPPKGFVDFGAPWQEQLRVTGRALGREEKAAAMVRKLEGGFDRARNENPEFEGKTGLVAYQFEPGTFGAYTSEDLRTRFIRELGFKVPKKVDELAGDEFYVEFSKEQFRLLDQDAVLMYGAPRSKRAQADDDPLFQRLNLVKEGRQVYMDNEDTLLGAVGLSTPYSLPYALQEAVPRLKAAVDGDPATKVKEAE
jgi:iron complex transport system substrate-binding protein